MALLKIEVKVTSWFKRYTGGTTEFSMELEEGSDVQNIIERLHIPMNEIGSVILTKSNAPWEKKKIDDHHIMMNGDQITLIPQILGG